MREGSRYKDPKGTYPYLVCDYSRRRFSSSCFVGNIRHLPQALPAGTAGEYTLDLAEEPLRDASGRPLSQAARRRKVAPHQLSLDMAHCANVSDARVPRWM